MTPKIKTTAKSKNSISKKPQVKQPWWRSYVLPAIIVLVAVGLAGGMLLLSNRNQSAKSAVPVCSGAQISDFKCWEKRFEAITTNQSPEQAFVDLKTAYAKNLYVQGQCHQFAHRIGRVALTRYGTVSKAYAHGDHFCSSGYYHGVIESVAAELGVEGVIAKINTICAEVKQKQPYSVYHHNCVHGLGHGIMGIEENELFDSLTVCKKLTDVWEQQSCEGGVFMENIMADGNVSHPAKYLKADQPLYPCTAVGDDEKTPCYLIQSSYALRINNYDFAKTFAQCAAADQAYVYICNQSVGRDASGMTSSDIARTVDNCHTAPDSQALTDCSIGATKDFIYFFHDDAKAHQLCAAFNEQSVVVACNQAATEYYKTF